MGVVDGGLRSVSEHKLLMMAVLGAGWDDRARVIWRVESVVRCSDRVEIEDMMLDPPAHGMPCGCRGCQSCTRTLFKVGL